MMDPEVLNLGERAASVNMGLFWLEKVGGERVGGGGGGEGMQGGGVVIRWVLKAFRT